MSLSLGLNEKVLIANEDAVNYFAGSGSEEQILKDKASENSMRTSILSAEPSSTRVTPGRLSFTNEESAPITLKGMRLELLLEQSS